MKKCIVLTIASVALGSSAICSAQSQAAAGFYSGVELASVPISDNSSSMRQELVSGLGGTASVSQDTSKVAYRLFAGYRLNENIDLEAGYMQSGSYGISMGGKTGGNVNYSGTASVKLDGFDYSVLLRPNADSGLNPFFVRVGGTHYSAKLTGSVNVAGVTTPISNKTSGNGTLWGVGYDFSNVVFGADVRASYTRMNKIGGDSDNKASAYAVALIKRF